MKFTTFHQHHQLVAHPQFIPPTNGNVSNGNNFQTQTIQVVNQQQQQHFVVPQQLQHHHQQFYDYNQQLPTSSSNYVSNNTYSRMSAPLGMTHFSPQQQQQPSSPQRGQQYWNQQQQYMMRNEINNIESG